VAYIPAYLSLHQHLCYSLMSRPLDLR